MLKKCFLTLLAFTALLPFSGRLTASTPQETTEALDEVAWHGGGGWRGGGWHGGGGWGGYPYGGGWGSYPYGYGYYYPYYRNYYYHYPYRYYNYW